MKVLLDTRIICESIARRPDAGCVEWLGARNPGELATSTITRAEVWQGVLNLDVADKRRVVFARFAEDLSQVFRMIRFDERAANAWEGISRRGLPPLPVRDSPIVAIALCRKRMVVTRDEDPFQHAGRRTRNPFPE